MHFTTQAGVQSQVKERRMPAAATVVGPLKTKSGIEHAFSYNMSESYIFSQLAA